MSTSIFIALILATIICIPFPAKALTFSFFVDNDGVFLSDREYTSGLFVRLSDALNSYGYSVEIGSQIWTPKNIDYTQPQLNERPFAGLLYLQGRVHHQTPRLALKTGMMIGMVGPNSFAEDIQTFAHQVIGSNQPNGWDYQIYDKYIYEFEIEAQHLVYRTNENKNDVGLYARTQLGNFQNIIAFGGVIRVGIDLENSFGSTSLSLNNNVDPSLLERSKSGAFFYAMAEVRHQKSAIVIEGDKPIHSDNISLKKAQSSASIGFVGYKKHWGASLSVIWQSDLIDSINARNHNFINAGIFYRFSP